jgi:hypothetical protein
MSRLRRCPMGWGLSRSTSLQPPVADNTLERERVVTQMCRRFPNLLYRRFPNRPVMAIPNPSRELRHAGLETRDTAALEVCGTTYCRVRNDGYCHSSLTLFFLVSAFRIQHLAFLYCPAGNLTVNVVPTFSSLATSIVPACAVTIA